MKILKFINHKLYLINFYIGLIKKHKYVVRFLSLIFSILLIAYLLFFLPYKNKKTYDFIYFIAFLGLFIAFTSYRLSSIVIWKIVFILYASIPFMLIFGWKKLAEKIAIWTFLLFIIMAYQKYRESKESSDENYNLKEDYTSLKKGTAQTFNFFKESYIVIKKDQVKTVIFLKKLRKFIQEEILSSEKHLQNSYFFFFFILNLLFVKNYKNIRFFLNYFQHEFVWFSFTKISIYLLLIFYILSILFLLFRVVKIKPIKHVLSIFYNRTFLLITVSFSLLSLLSIGMVLTGINERVNTRPVIISIYPKESITWQQVRIKGKNFGVAQYNGAQVYVNGQEHRVLRWENDEVIFVVDPIKSSSGELWVKNVDQSESNRVEFTYLDN